MVGNEAVAVPYNANTIFVVEPDSDTYTAGLGFSASGSFQYGTLAVVGNKVVAAPLDANANLVVEPDSDSYTTVPGSSDRGRINTGPRLWAATR